MFEIVVVWADGQKNSVWPYETREKAEEVVNGMKKALGEQVEWIGVRRRYA